MCNCHTYIYYLNCWEKIPHISNTFIGRSTDIEQPHFSIHIKELPPKKVLRNLRHKHRFEPGSVRWHSFNALDLIFHIRVQLPEPVQILLTGIPVTTSISLQEGRHKFTE